MQNELKQTIGALAILMLVASQARTEPRATPNSEQEQRTVVLPYMAVGGAPEGWHFLTVLSIENSHRFANTGTIEFFTADGRPLHVQLNDSAGLAARSEWRVSGKDSTLLVVSHPGGSFEDGWLRIRLGRKDAIKVIVLVQCYNGEHLFAEAGAVGHPGEPVNGPYYRISSVGSNTWKQWSAPDTAPHIALLSPGSSGRRNVEQLAEAAQSLSQSGCNRSQETSAPSGVSAVAETGFASWYGDKYHGKISASGAAFDQWALTAAHRTLPFGTRVKITNLRNGCSVKVRIADRGPFIPGRIVDLSSTAARRIELIKEGVAKVRLETLPS
jgi:rare lipoprotein A